MLSLMFNIFVRSVTYFMCILFKGIVLILINNVALTYFMLHFPVISFIPYKILFNIDLKYLSSKI